MTFYFRQPGNDMAFHRIFPCCRNLRIPRYWGLDGLSLGLNLNLYDIFVFPYLFLTMGIHFSHVLIIVLIHRKHFSRSKSGKDMVIPIMFHELGKIFPYLPKSPQPGNMTFHKTFPWYETFDIPRFWEFHVNDYVLTGYDMVCSGPPKVAKVAGMQ